MKWNIEKCLGVMVKSLLSSANLCWRCSILRSVVIMESTCSIRNIICSSFMKNNGEVSVTIILFFFHQQEVIMWLFHGVMGFDRMVSIQQGHLFNSIGMEIPIKWNLMTSFLDYKIIFIPSLWLTNLFSVTLEMMLLFKKSIIRDVKPQATIVDEKHKKISS